MRPSDLKYIYCPVTRTPLVVEREDSASEGHLLTGILRSESGNYRYSVDYGVPNLMQPIGTQQVTDHQNDTLDMFGKEWAEFRRWGWYDDYPDVSQAELKYYGGLVRDTESAFRAKAMLSPEEIGPDEILLDAGCGNGRFCNLAAKTGCTVIGIDAGSAAYAAFENLKDKPNVVIVRASVLNAPFVDNFFDRVYSIGVIQHTGNAQRMVQEMIRVTRPRGTFSLNCYGKGLPTYEVVDWVLRQMVIRLPRGKARAVTNALARFDRILRRGGWLGRKLRLALFVNMNLLPTEIHMLDWYTPKIAEHFSPKEVLQWFDGNVSRIHRANPRFDHDDYRDWRRRARHGAMSIMIEK